MTFNYFILFYLFLNLISSELSNFYLFNIEVKSPINKNLQNFDVGELNYEIYTCKRLWNKIWSTFSSKTLKTTIAKQFKHIKLDSFEDNFKKNKHWDAIVSIVCLFLDNQRFNIFWYVKTQCLLVYWNI